MNNDWNDAEQRVERAAELFEQRLWQEALDELRAATNINPYNASWFFNIGLTLDEMGRFPEAIDAYQQALLIDENDVLALHHLALDFQQIGKFRESITTFEKIESVDPTFEPSYCGRIVSYTELGEHQKAEEMFYLARLYKDHCDECFHNIGISLAERGEYDRAIFCFSQTFADDGEDWPGVHFRIARVYSLKRDFEQARRHFVTGLRQDPGNVDVLLELADLLVDAKRLDEAGEKYRRAIELAPENPAAHCAYGRWAILQDRLSDAESALLRALQLDPTCPTAHLQLGAVYSHLNRIAEARRHLRGELLLRPEDRQTLSDLGNLLIDVGELRAAVACFKRLTQLNAADASAWLNLGVAHFMRSRFELGIHCCERCLAIDPRNTVAYFNVALAMIHMREFDEALAMARRGLALSPRDLQLQRLEFRSRLLGYRAKLTSVFYATIFFWRRPAQ